MRNCDGDPTRTERVFHPWIDPGLATRVCPMRVAQDPAAQHYLARFVRWKATGALPRDGGQDEQPADEMDALLLCEGIYQEAVAFHRQKFEREHKATMKP